LRRRLEVLVRPVEILFEVDLDGEHLADIDR
jgi:hypothetical protein